MNRMIKERHFKVHPNVISCLWYLRLKSDLNGIRASETKADKETDGDVTGKGANSRKKGKGKGAEKPYLSKKARKRLKENKAIEEEMHEAEAEVDKTERDQRVRPFWSQSSDDTG